MNCFLSQLGVEDVIERLQEQFVTLSIGAMWLVCWFLPVGLLCYGIYYLISLPLRRQERARMLLDVMQTGLQRGQSAEQGIVAAASSEDTALGARFHLLAAHIEGGLRLEQALDKVPRLLPPPVVAMLKVGAELGNLASVLPACRRQLKDGLSAARSGLNFVLVMVFVIMPVFPAVFFVVATWVLPRFEYIFQDMVGTGLPASCWTLPLVSRLMGVQVVLVLAIQVLAVCYVGGPRLKCWLDRIPRLGALADRMLWRLPWRRKRMQRNFSMMLALLLDAGVTERRAVELAAACAANRVFQHRAELVVGALQEGQTLPEALKKIDDSDELHWRVSNAARSGHGFFAALAGWIEALDAKAFQQEQAAAQLVTTGLVLFNGVMVGLFAVGIFQALTTLIQEATLW